VICQSIQVREPAPYTSFGVAPSGFVGVCRRKCLPRCSFPINHVRCGVRSTGRSRPSYYRSTTGIGTIDDGVRQNSGVIIGGGDVLTSQRFLRIRVAARQIKAPPRPVLQFASATIQFCHSGALKPVLVPIPYRGTIRQRAHTVWVRGEYFGSFSPLFFSPLTFLPGSFRSP